MTTPTNPVPFDPMNEFPALVEILNALRLELRAHALVNAGAAGASVDWQEIQQIQFNADNAARRADSIAGKDWDE